MRHSNMSGRYCPRSDLRMTPTCPPPFRGRNPTISSVRFLLLAFSPLKRGRQRGFQRTRGSIHHLSPPNLPSPLPKKYIHPTPPCPDVYSRAMSLLHPPPGFPPHLAIIWPLIWVQVLVLRAAVRAAYGRGTQYHWSVTPCGRVFITSIDWIPGQTEAPDWLQPAAHPNARLAAALDGSAFAPDYIELNPLRPDFVEANALRSLPLASPRQKGLPIPDF